MLSVIISRIFTGILGESGGLDQEIGVFDKPDKPAGPFLIYPHIRYSHSIVRRHHTFDLAVVFYSIFFQGEIISAEQKKRLATIF